MLSTKELAIKWNISQSRIVRLAKAGRIEGASLIGKSWIFPDNVERLPDNRRKENKAIERKIPFRFPLYFYYNYSPEEINAKFTNEEKGLYEAEGLFFAGKFKECSDKLETLKKQIKDRHVYIGALYYLCSSYIYQGNFSYADCYYRKAIILAANENEYKDEFSFVINNLDTYFIGNTFYADKFNINTEKTYPIQMRGYLLLECAFADFMAAATKHEKPNPLLYELFCNNEDNSLSPLTLTTLHLYISLIYSSTGNNQKAIYHLKKSLKMAEDFNFERQVSLYAKYKIDLYKSAIAEDNPSQLERIIKYSEETFKTFKSSLDYFGKNSIFKSLSETDIKLINFASQGLLNKEVADIMKLSVNTISKKYALLLEKTETHSKAELVILYNKSFKNY